MPTFEERFDKIKHLFNLTTDITPKEVQDVTDTLGVDPNTAYGMLAAARGVTEKDTVI